MTKGALSLSERFDRGLTAQRARATEAISFRAFLESPDFAAPYLGGRGLSPVVGAIVDASEGRVPALDEAALQRVFRCGRAGFASGVVPGVVVLGAGRRGGKTSRLVAPKAVHAAWTVPLPDLAPGEIARSVVIAPDLDLAAAFFNFAKGVVESSPVLSAAVEKINTEEIVLRRPDAKLVEIVTGAANRGGRAGRSRTLVYAALDEAAFFFAADGHTINDRTIYTAILPAFGIPPAAGTQLWVTSTPWVQELGLMEELIKDHWGKPGRVLVAARVSSYDLRGVEDLGQLREGYDEETYSREILAVPFPAGAGSFFYGPDVASALEAMPPAGPAEELGAGGDFAFDRDSSAIVIAKRHSGGIFSASLALEEKPPMVDVQVCKRFAAATKTAGLDRIAADTWQQRSISTHLADNGIGFVGAPAGEQGKRETYIAAKSLLADRRLCLGALPEAMRRRIQVQLRQVIAQELPGGALKITSPRPPTRRAMAAGEVQESGHGDVVSALVLALWMAGSTRPELWATGELAEVLEPDEEPPSDPYGRGPRDDLVWRD